MEYTRTITIDNADVPSTLTNFVLYVDLTLGSNVANASGYDVHFQDSTNAELSFDLEDWDNTAKRWRGWVKIPSLSSSADTVLTVLYGDSGITTNQSSTATWSAFAGVWFLSETSTGASVHLDRTATANHMSGVGSQLTAGVTGKLTRALSRNGTTTEVSRGVTDSNIVIPNGDLTIMFWTKLNSTTQNNNGQLLYEVSGGRYRFYSTGGAAFTYRHYSTSGSFQTMSGGTMSDTDWKHSALRISATDNAGFTYVDGTQVTTNASANIYMGTTSKVAVLQSSNVLQSADASVSHLMIMTADSGADWVSVAYNNQNDPNTFYALGSETSSGGGTNNGAGFFGLM